MKSRRARSCAISKKVKLAVWERDNHRCIICGSPYGQPNAHVIPRSKGGLGVEKNIVTLCPACHRKFDQGVKEEREGMKEYINYYLSCFYGEIDKDEVVYRKGGSNGV